MFESGEQELVKMELPEGSIDYNNRSSWLYSTVGTVGLYPVVTMNEYLIQPTGTINHRSHGLVWRVVLCTRGTAAAAAACVCACGREHSEPPYEGGGRPAQGD